MSFHHFALSYGIDIHDLQPGECVRRCSTATHPHKKNGAYFWDGRRGWVSDWAEGGEIHWFDNPQARTWREQERQAWAQKKRATELAQAMAWQAAAKRAQTLIDLAEPKTHYYLNAKGFPDALGLVAETTLVIPMRSCISGELQGVQLIDWNAETRTYDKKMNYGMRAKGAVLRLGNARAAETFLCEGYATGLSGEVALRQLRLDASVLICFSDSNMVYVASMIKGKAFVIADNDKSLAGETAAKKTGLPYVMSATLGEDANDLHQRAGIMALCELIMEVRRTL